MPNLSRIAAQFTNVVDRVAPAPHAPVPGFTVIRRVDPVFPDENFTREKARDTGKFWDEWNDLTLAHLVGKDR